MLKNVSKILLTSLMVMALALSFGFAQDWYAGGGVAGVSDFDNDVTPMVSMQLGTTLDSMLGFRGSVDTQFETTLVNLDVLYNLAFPETTEFTGVGYLGLGPSASFDTSTDEIEFEPGLHATLGLESLQDNFGIFAELQPAVFTPDLADFDAYHAGACIRVGLNFHF